MILGRGILDWHRSERITDRYGAIHLSHRLKDDPDTATPADFVDFSDQFDGLHGSLFAVVLETRDSIHVGDMLRRLFPSTPQVGERFCLGTGTLWIGELRDNRDSYGDSPPKTIGLLPDDRRAHDWLNPQVLYKLHQQTVELHFEKTPSSFWSGQLSDKGE